MSLTGLCIRRPVTTLMFYAFLMLFGCISLVSMKQELFPSIEYPKLSIVTNYENAAPEEIETLISKPIEEAVGSTPGLRSVTSISREGISVVVAEFGWDQPMDFAALNVREKIDLIKARLPRDAEEPTVLKFNPFVRPVLKLSVSSDLRSPVKLKRFTEKWFKDEIEKVNGVASVTLSGGEDEEIIVDVDQGRLKATDIGVNDISKVLSAANLNYPGGTIKESFYEYLVRTMGEFRTVDEIGKVALNKKEDAQTGAPGEEEDITPELVLLKDVANIYRTVQKRTSFSRYDQRENITLSVQKQATANTIRVVDDILAKLDELKLQMPEDIHSSIIYNQADFIKDAIHGVRDAAMQGGVLAFLVLLVFLRRALLSVLVVLITPITIIATFSFLYFMGISLNIISLGGIAISVGLLVDSAIVVIENVFRRVRENPGSDFNKEVELSCNEVIAPVLSSILTTVVVFLPMVFVIGVVGQLIKDLAWVVVIMLLLSFGVAFTILPVLIVKFRHSLSKMAVSKETAHKGILTRVLDVVALPITGLQNLFRKVLPGLLMKRGRYLLMVFGLFVFSGILISGLDRIMMPKVDQGQFSLKVDMPVGTRVEITNQITSVIEKYLAAIPEVQNVSVIVGSQKGGSTKEAIQRIGSHQAEVTVNLKEKRAKSTDLLVQEVRQALAVAPLKKQLLGARISYVLNDSLFSVGGEESAPVTIDIKGNRMDVLKHLAEEVQDKIEQIPGIYDVTNTFPESSPETKINVNKDKASFYRLSVTDLATAAHISIRGIVATKFKEEGREIPIRVVLQEHTRDAVSKLPFILMHSPLGVSVPLAELVTFQTGRGPSEIKRIDQERTIQVFAKIFERSLREVTADVEKALSEVKTAQGYHVYLAGASVEVTESFNSLCFALLLSVVLVYMIMAAQFESYYQPFIIMFTVPLALIGVSLGLVVTGTPLSVIVILGVMFLGGLVVNNAIILIDFINQRIGEGMPVFEAVVDATRVRLRPILMTALTSILGLLPLALGLGKGVRLLSPMGIVQMGGLLISTFLTLFVIPAVYLSTSKLRRKLGGSPPTSGDKPSPVGVGK